MKEQFYAKYPLNIRFLVDFSLVQNYLSKTMVLVEWRHTPQRKFLGYFAITYVGGSRSEHAFLANHSSAFPNDVMPDVFGKSKIDF